MDRARLSVDETATTSWISIPMEGVREHSEGLAVELLPYGAEGRLVIRAWNECGNNYTNVDLGDLIEWLRAGPRIL
jgi:hypothetical protein